MSDIARRKREHLDAIAQDPAIERGDSGFAAIRLMHRALPAKTRAASPPSAPPPSSAANCRCLLRKPTPAN